ncbi:MAG: hypothetical protein OXU45_07750 [Candidatus Melainabacteria bacterium]|nr:hypothetical protein [Candidatus Melainabacteria bacterium]
MTNLAGNIIAKVGDSYGIVGPALQAGYLGLEQAYDLRALSKEFLEPDEDALRTMAQDLAQAANNLGTDFSEAKIKGLAPDQKDAVKAIGSLLNLIQRMVELDERITEIPEDPEALEFNPEEETILNLRCAHSTMANLFCKIREAAEGQADDIKAFFLRLIDVIGNLDGLKDHTQLNLSD